MSCKNPNEQPEPTGLLKDKRWSHLRSYSLFEIKAGGKGSNQAKMKVDDALKYYFYQYIFFFFPFFFQRYNIFLSILLVGVISTMLMMGSIDAQCLREEKAFIIFTSHVNSEHQRALSHCCWSWTLAHCRSSESSWTPVTPGIVLRNLFF